MLEAPERFAWRAPAWWNQHCLHPQKDDTTRMHYKSRSMQLSVACCALNNSFGATRFGIRNTPLNVLRNCDLLRSGNLVGVPPSRQTLSRIGTLAYLCGWTDLNSEIRLHSGGQVRKRKQPRDAGGEAAITISVDLIVSLHRLGHLTLDQH